MKEVGAADRREVGRRLNNRAENSHQPFRRWEGAMQRFRSLKTLQTFSSVHAQVHNQFNQERHLVTRKIYKQRRSAALAEWRRCGVDRHLKEGVCPTSRRTAVTLTTPPRILNRRSRVRTERQRAGSQEDVTSSSVIWPRPTYPKVGFLPLLS
jgi:hypothetical protein